MAIIEIPLKEFPGDFIIPDGENNGGECVDSMTFQEYSVYIAKNVNFNCYCEDEHIRKINLVSVSLLENGEEVVKSNGSCGSCICYVTLASDLDNDILIENLIYDYLSREDVINFETIDRVCEGIRKDLGVNYTGIPIYKKEGEF